MSIFSGKNGLRHQFGKLIPADLAGATDTASAVLLLEFKNWGRMNFLDNTLQDASDNPIDVGLVLQHPEGTIRLFWIELPGLRVINYSTGDAPGISFDPGTKLYAYVVSGTPTQGALRISAWG